MKRRYLFSLAAVGGALSLLLGSGLLTLSSDSITSAGNNVDSGTVEGSAAGSHDLRVALVNAPSGQRFPSASACPTSAKSYQPVTSIPASLDGQTVTLGSSSGGEVAGDTDVLAASRKWICLKNNNPAGTPPANLFFTLTGVQQSEVGQCEASEAEAGDGSCTEGAAGEMGPVVSLLVRDNGFDYPDNPPPTPPCGGSGSSGYAFHFAGRHKMTTLRGIEPGELCVLWVMVRRTPSTEQDRLKAQTDRLAWDMIFTLEDRPQ